MFIIKKNQYHKSQITNKQNAGFNTYTQILARQSTNKLTKKEEKQQNKEKTNKKKKEKKNALMCK